MLRRILPKIAVAGGGVQRWNTVFRRQTSTVSSAVNLVLLRSLKDHYVEVSNMASPPKVGPPLGFEIIKGALDGAGPVLKKNYKNEEISLSVMRLSNFAEPEDDEDADEINQLFVDVEISKPEQEKAVHVLLGLYPDAVGIHAVALRPKSYNAFEIDPKKYTGPSFEALNEETRDAFHDYIEERGITESLFPFLQAWLYVKDHRNIMAWFRSVGTFIKGAQVVKAVPGANDPKKAAKSAAGNSSVTVEPLISSYSGPRS